MAKAGPIVIIEDDYDDQEFIHDTLKELQIPNTIIFFSNTTDAFMYLKSTHDSPFLIICDINLPGTNGLEFKQQLDADDYMRERSIPFVFLTTSASKPAVKEAFTQMTVQGFFEKTTSLTFMKNMLRAIIEYWTLSKHPNSG